MCQAGPRSAVPAKLVDSHDALSPPWCMQAPTACSHHSERGAGERAVLQTPSLADTPGADVHHRSDCTGGSFHSSKRRETSTMTTTHFLHGLLSEQFHTIVLSILNSGDSRVHLSNIKTVFWVLSNHFWTTHSTVSQRKVK